MSTTPEYVQVQNLSDSPVVFVIPEKNFRCAFGPHEGLNVDVEDLRRVAYQPGGRKLLQDYLSIKDKKLAAELAGVTEDSFDHEYNWTDDDIKNLLTNGTQDELLDALDFAPEGIVDAIVDQAIKLRIPDVNKREAITKATGRDINEMIKVQETVEKELGAVDAADATPRRRRAATTSTEETTEPRRRRSE